MNTSWGSKPGTSAYEFIKGNAKSYKELPHAITKNAEEIGLLDKDKIPEGYVQSFIKDVLRFNKDKGFEVGILWLRSYKAKRKEESGEAKRLLSAKRRRALQLSDWKSQKLRYNTFIPLHDLWLQYFHTLMGTREFLNFQLKNESHLHSRLLKADYHGCKMTVVKSKCPPYVGLTGILIQETRNIFRIICEDDTTKIIPKQNSILKVTVEDFHFLIHGSNFRVRSSERSVKKFKSKSTLNL